MLSIPDTPEAGKTISRREPGTRLRRESLALHGGDTVAALKGEHGARLNRVSQKSFPQRLPASTALLCTGTYYFRDDPCYAERVDDILTVFFSFETKELVGCKVKGVKHILQTAGDFGVSLDDGAVRLGIFFFVGASLAKDQVQRGRYDQIGRQAKEVTLDRRELEAGC